MINWVRRHAAAFGAATLIVLLVMLSASLSSAQAPKQTPEAEKILERYVEAIGGRAAFDAMNNAVTKATLNIPAVGISLDLTVYSARPNKFRSTAESPAIGAVERGTDGTVFWEKSTMQGARVLEGEELAEALSEASFENLVYWRTNYDSVAVAGTDTVEGSLCDKVVMKAKGGKPRTLYFDQKSGLVVKTQTVASTQMGKIPIDAFISDYRKVGEVTQAYKTVMNIMGQDRVITTTSIEYNAAIPDSVFAIPADIQALMEK